MTLSQDRQPAGQHKHIIFDSDVEDNAEVDEKLIKDANLGNAHGEVSVTGKKSINQYDVIRKLNFYTELLTPEFPFAWVF